MDFFSQHLSEILSFIGGVIAGVFGSLVTIHIKSVKTNSAKNSSSIVDQSGATAGRDIVGGNSSTRN